MKARKWWTCLCC